MVDNLASVWYNGGRTLKEKESKMNEVQEISNYINERINYWQQQVKNEKDERMKEWTNGQIFESTKILKHIQDEYGINPNN